MNSMMNLRFALLWGMTVARFASSSLPMHSSCGHSDEELCGQSNEALDMLQHGAMPKVSSSKAAPGMDFAARKSLTQTDGKGRVACDFQTAGFTCLNWENLLLWWLPLGRNYHGWLPLLVQFWCWVAGSPGRQNQPKSWNLAQEPSIAR